MVAQIAMWLLGIMACATALLADTPFWSRPLPSAVKKVEVEDRCALVSRVLHYQPEIHKGELRVSFFDLARERGVVWHGKPLACPSIQDTKTKKVSPLFAQGEECTADFMVHNAEVLSAADRPKLCIHVGLTPRPDQSFDFEVFFAGLSEPMGAGTLPADGNAFRKEKEWQVRRLRHSKYLPKDAPK
jgi:hypothetical protein